MKDVSLGLKITKNHVDRRLSFNYAELALLQLEREMRDLSIEEIRVLDIYTSRDSDLPITDSVEQILGAGRSISPFLTTPVNGIAAIEEVRIVKPITVGKQTISNSLNSHFFRLTVQVHGSDQHSTTVVQSMIQKFSK